MMLNEGEDADVLGEGTVSRDSCTLELVTH